MHELFSDWLEEAGLDVRNVPLASWSDGLEAYCSTIDRESLLRLLNFVSSGKGVETLVPFGLREALKEKDSAFRMRGNTFLVAELARAGTRMLFDSKNINHNLGRAAALGMIVGSFGQTVTPVHTDHIQKANQYLVFRAEELRVRPKFEAIKDPTETELSKIQNAADIAQLKDPLTKIAAALSKNLSNVDASFSRLRIQDEELNILWWLFGEASRDLKRPFCELSLGAAAVVAASELADLVAFPPGPNSAEAFLRRALRRKNDHKPSEPISVADAVNALEKDWTIRAKAILVPLGDAAPLCPLHLIITKTCEAASQDDWPALVRASCEVSPDLELDPVTLALQVFQERMFSMSIQLIANSNA